MNYKCLNLYLREFILRQHSSLMFTIKPCHSPQYFAGEHLQQNCSRSLLIGMTFIFRYFCFLQGKSQDFKNCIWGRNLQQLSILRLFKLRCLPTCSQRSKGIQRGIYTIFMRTTEISTRYFLNWYYFAGEHAFYVLLDMHVYSLYRKV